MDAISYSTARAHLSGTMNKVCENHEPVVITRLGEEETTFFLRSPANAQRLLRSIAGLNSGGGEENDLLPCDWFSPQRPGRTTCTLRHALAGYWSQLIDAEHRIIYCISCRQRGLPGFVRSVQN